ncbi:MAG: hypothetical protein U1E83_03360 [Methylotetracoccus sp.]
MPHKSHRYFAKGTMMHPRKAVVFLATLTTLAPVLAAHAKGPTRTLTEWHTPSTDSYPNQLRFAPDASLYFTEVGGNKIARLASEKGEITEWAIPTTNTGPVSLSFDDRGRAYFTEQNWHGEKGVTEKIGRLDPDTGIITEWAIPTPKALINDLCVDKNGAVFFNEVSANKIGRLDPEAARIAEWNVPVPSPGSDFLQGLALDQSGNVIVTGYGQSTVVYRLDASANKLTTWTAPGAYAALGEVTVDRQGQIWFTEEAAMKIGRLDAVANVLTEWDVPGGAKESDQLYALDVDKRGNVYFGIQFANKIARLSSSNGTIIQWKLPPTSENPYPELKGSRVPSGVTLSADGAVYFAEFYGNSIGRLIATTPSGTPAPMITEAPATTVTVLPEELVLTPREREAQVTSSSVKPTKTLVTPSVRKLRGVVY